MGNEYGTRQDKKVGGDASSSACGYGGQGSSSARRRACGRRARTGGRETSGLDKMLAVEGEALWGCPANKGASRDWAFLIY